MKINSIIITTVAIILIVYTLVKLYLKEGSIAYIVFGVALLCLGGCTTSEKTKKKRVRLLKEYVANTYKDTLSFVNLNIDQNAGNLFDKEFTHSGVYRTNQVNEKDIRITFYLDKDSIDVVRDKYFIEKAYMGLEKKIENSIDNINFAISLSPIVYEKDLQGIDYTTPLDELRTQVYTKTSTFRASIRVVALDFKENREKYLQFHIDLMCVFKENNLKKGNLDFEFCNYDINLEVNRPKVDEVSTIPSIERWSSIHNNKWYDLVKDHPDKVLKYGKVFN